MSKFRQIWRSWRTSREAVWLPVLPPLGAFAELAALIGIISFADAIFPALDVASLEPSPYWIPVLLLSLQYGTVAGLLAAGAAIAVYAIGGLPEQLVEENHFTYLLRVWALPILWIAVALVLGQFRLRQIEIKQRLKNQLGKSEAEAASLARYATSLELRCKELERQITSSGTSRAQPVLDALDALGSHNLDLAQALRRLARVIFEGGELSVFLAGPAGLEQCASSSEASEAGARVVGTDHPLYLAIVQDKRGVSLLTSPADEATLAGLGLAAVPILQHETGRIIGMLKLDQAEAEDCSGRVAAHLALIAKLLSPLVSEPRIVIDNTIASTSPTRLTRGWRHYFWQSEPDGNAGPEQRLEETGSRAGGRPRIIQQ